MEAKERAEKIDAKIYGHTFDSAEERLAWIAAEIEKSVEEERELRADWNYRIECLESHIAKLEKALRDIRDGSFEKYAITKAKSVLGENDK